MKETQRYFLLMELIAIQKQLQKQNLTSDIN